jgi:hypothetical protein
MKCVEKRTTTMQPQIPIPRIYWDALQVSLNAEVKRFAKEIANVLNQPEQPLLNAIKQKTVGVYLFEEAESELVDIQEMRCSFLIHSTENPSVLCRCNQPILLGAGNACPAHLYKTSPNPIGKRLRIVKSYSGENFWVDEDNCIRRKGDLKEIGRYIPESKQCLLFQIE